ncbi:hypothetical protein AA14337_3140 [Acetobacter malorum DSM 14337]|uniref:Uncharacterized protein n=1 Tax=Acetobacter malorum DSM 14337 TaxID=1307910 RepID=A0ABQ0PZV3_9PROT|nr:hypothetical protein [Acetobacter malorum]KXV05717.1 hypothetical protein AD930_11335 [Acetobacter malorum]GBQ85696.1 hypothetical protein AA14337_3140 [Acetobacter malorum DSM 14337]
MTPPASPEDRIINDLLNDAYLIKAGLMDGGIPDLRPYSLDQCVKAVEAMRKDPGERVGNARRFTCCVDVALIPTLRAWSVSAHELNVIVEGYRGQ